MSIDDTQLLTTVEAARKLGVTRVRVLALIRKGRIAAQKLGRDWLIKLEDLDAFERKPQGNYSLSLLQIKEIQERLKQGESVDELAKIYGVSTRTIYRHAQEDRKRSSGR